MARQPSQSKVISNDRKRQKFFKFINKYLLGDKSVTQYLDNISSMSDDDFMINRLYFSLQYYPNIMKYLNMYMNDLYKFKTYSFYQYLKTFKHLVRMNNIKNSSDFCYVKKRQTDYSQFRFNLEKYTNYSSEEIRCLYKLYVEGIVTQIDINELKSEDTIKDLKVDDSIEEEVPIKKEEDDSNKNNNELTKFQEQLLEFKKNNNSCRACPGYSNKMYPIKDSEQTDIIIVNTIPLTLNHKQENKIIDDIIYRLGNRSYKILNLISCHPDENNIKNQIKFCSEVFKILLNDIKPKLFILFGSDVKKEFGIKGAMPQITGKIHFGKYFLFDSLHNISSTNAKYKRFEKDLEELDKLLETFDFGDSKKIQEVPLDSRIKIPKDRMLNKPNKDVSLFEIKTIGDNILYIFKHIENNKKYYMLKPYIQKIGIKKGNIMECDYISNQEMDAIAYLTKTEKSKLMYRLKKQIDEEVIGI